MKMTKTGIRATRAGVLLGLASLVPCLGLAQARTSFDSEVSARYIVLSKSFTRDPDASHKIWDHYLSPPLHYPGVSKCKGNGFTAFREAAQEKYTSEVKALYGKSDRYVTVFDQKSAVLNDGWPNEPMLTVEDATSFLQRRIAHLNQLGKEVDYGDYAIHQTGFTLSCSELQPAKTPAKPSGYSGMAGGGTAPASSRGGITRVSDTPSPAALEAQRAQKRRQDQVDAEKKRLGAHREAEARKLVEMREKAERARGRRCEGTRAVNVGGHSDPDSLSTSTALFPGWSTREKALASARRGLGPSCRNMTGDAGFSGAKESCTQDAFKKWTCTVEATCMKQVSKCPAGAQ